MVRGRKRVSGQTDGIGGLWRETPSLLYCSRAAKLLTRCCSHVRMLASTPHFFSSEARRQEAHEKSPHFTPIQSQSQPDASEPNRGSRHNVLRIQSKPPNKLLLELATSMWKAHSTTQSSRYVRPPRTPLEPNHKTPVSLSCNVFSCKNENSHVLHEPRDKSDGTNRPTPRNAKSNN